MSDRWWAWFAVLVVSAFMWVVIIVGVVAVLRSIR